jgi:ketosteroid isomerase-like protein
MSTEENKRLVATMMEGWGRPGPYYDSLAANVVFSHMCDEDTVTFGTTITGRDALLRATQRYLELRPDFQMRIQGMTAEENRVVVEIGGADLGLPPEVQIFEVEDGKVVRIKEFADTAYFMAHMEDAVMYVRGPGRTRFPRP